MGLNKEYTFGILLQKFNLNLISPTPIPLRKQCFKLYCVQNVLLFYVYQFLIVDFKKVKRTSKIYYTYVLVHFSNLIPRLQNSFTVYLNF